MSCIQCMTGPNRLHSKLDRNVARSVVEPEDMVFGQQNTNVWSCVAARTVTFWQCCFVWSSSIAYLSMHKCGMEALCPTAKAGLRHSVTSQLCCDTARSKKESSDILTCRGCCRLRVNVQHLQLTQSLTCMYKQAKQRDRVHIAPVTLSHLSASQYGTTKWSVPACPDLSVSYAVRPAE